MDIQPITTTSDLINNNMLLSKATTTLAEGRLEKADTDLSSDENSASLCSLSSSTRNTSSTSKMSQLDVPCQSSQELPQDIRLRDISGSGSASAASGYFCPRKQHLKLFQSTPNMKMEPEVDTRDVKPAMEPLHFVGALGDLPPVTRQLSKALPTPVTPRKPRLTLSAFRKPEETVRLTDCDASRLLENEYSFRAPGCRVIGHGAFSTVRLAIRCLDGMKVAVKSLSKFDALRARRLRRTGTFGDQSNHMDEWEIMKLLKDNPYVLTLLDVFETEEEIHLVTEYCEGGELFDAIKRKGSRRSSFRRGRYSEAQAARITSQVLHALLELHDHGIVHRDIKAENILLLNDDETDIQVKLADFGVARRHSCAVSVDGESSPSTPGLTYTTNAPPEVSSKGACGPAADIFSLGVTLYILLCGFPPVFCNNSVEFPDAYWGDISEDAKAVVRAMLHSDPSIRITVHLALKNPWIRQQTTLGRRGSISANLELVRSRLYKTMGDSVSPCPKRRRGSLTTLSPKKQCRLSTQLTISMTDLYSVSEKGDVRVIEERIESQPTLNQRSTVQ